MLSPEEWTASARGTLAEPATARRYPAGWEIAVPGEGIRLVVDAGGARRRRTCPRWRAGSRYWEGPVRLTDGDGRAAGEGYVELTGYGEGTRPPL